MGHIRMPACSLRRSELLTVTRQVAQLNCASAAAKSAIVDCLLLNSTSARQFENCTPFCGELHDCF